MKLAFLNVLKAGATDEKRVSTLISQTANLYPLYYFRFAYIADLDYCRPLLLIQTGNEVLVRITRNNKRKKRVLDFMKKSTTKPACDGFKLKANNDKKTRASFHILLRRFVAI